MEIPILIWLIVQPYGNLNPSRKEKMCKLFWPLKDLKGSSVWKGSAGGSFAAFAPLLLNMAIFDLKASSWWIKKEKDITVSSSFFSLLSLFWSLFTKETRQIHMMANICISRKRRNYELQTPSLGDAWFTSSVEAKIAKEQASNEVNLFWLRNFGAFIWTVSTHVWFRASSGQQGIYSWSPHRTPEASVLPLAKSFAQVRQVAEVAAIEVTQCAAVLLNGLCQLLLAVLDQRQFSASLKKKTLKHDKEFVIHFQVSELYWRALFLLTSTQASELRKKVEFQLRRNSPLIHAITINGNITR